MEKFYELIHNIKLWFLLSRNKYCLSIFYKKLHSSFNCRLYSLYRSKEQVRNNSNNNEQASNILYTLQYHIISLKKFLQFYLLSPYLIFGERLQRLLYNILSLKRRIRNLLLILKTIDEFPKVPVCYLLGEVFAFCSKL